MKTNPKWETKLYFKFIKNSKQADDAFDHDAVIICAPDILKAGEIFREKYSIDPFDPNQIIISKANNPYDLMTMLSNSKSTLIIFPESD
ncbi:MAG TPA: hypothetical protein VHP30_01360 [Ignavibacteriales bacterium]|nr:hypothetical protein [Ignavibacteriales bacterium]